MNQPSKKMRVKRLKREPYYPFGLKIKDLKKFVTDTQVLLAMAIREQNANSTKQLCRLLSNSRKSRAYALYLVITKKGYRSKGLSERKPTTNEDYENIIEQLKVFVKNPQKYTASPLLRTLIPKPKGGLRPISVPTYTDRALQTLYNFVLDVYSEEIQGPRSFGFRKYRSPGWGQKAITLCCWSRKFNPPRSAIQFDIKGCYDNIAHPYIMIMSTCSVIKIQDVELIPKQILNVWLNCGFILTDNPTNKVDPTTGVPQGGPISPTISNNVLAGFENHIKNAITTKLAWHYPPQTAPRKTNICGTYTFYVTLSKDSKLFLFKHIQSSPTKVDNQ